MKIIKYYILQGTDENGNDILLPKMMDYSESNLICAEAEAYNGKYTIEDDGRPEPVAEPTTDDILNAMLGVM